MRAVRADGDDVLLFVRVKPRAQKSRVIGPRAGNDDPAAEVEIALRAPPVDGAANEELIRLLASQLGISRGRVTIERGQASRHKVVRLMEVSVQQARHGLGL
jgi:uncharacterized protein